MLRILIGLIVFATNPLPRALTVLDLADFNGPYGNLQNPAALQAEDVDRWARTLDVTAQQLEFLQQRYIEFAERHNRYMEHDGKAYLAKCRELGDLQNTTTLTSREMLRTTEELLGQTRRFQAGLEQRELEYVDSLVPVLNDEQIDQLYLLRNEASRRQSRSFRFLDRWSNVDLRLVWEAMLSDDIGAADREAMERLLADYEVRVTPLLARLAEQYASNGVEIMEIMADEAEGRINTETATNRYRAAWNKIGNAFEQVQKATQDTVTQASVILTEPVGKLFVAEAKMAAFPELYPDRTYCDQLFINLMTNATITPQQQQDVMALRLGYQEQYAAACLELETFCIEWGHRRARGESGSQRQFLTDELIPRLAKRDEISAKWLHLAEDVVGEQVVKAHMPNPPSMQRTPLQRRATSAGTIDPEQIADRKMRPSAREPAKAQ